MNQKKNHKTRDGAKTRDSSPLSLQALVLRANLSAAICASAAYFAIGSASLALNFLFEITKINDIFARRGLTVFEEVQSILIFALSWAVGFAVFKITSGVMNKYTKEGERQAAVREIFTDEKSAEFFESYSDNQSPSVRENPDSVLKARENRHFINNKPTVSSKHKLAADIPNPWRAKNKNAPPKRARKFIYDRTLVFFAALFTLLLLNVIYAAAFPQMDFSIWEKSDGTFIFLIKVFGGVLVYPALEEILYRNLFLNAMRKNSRGAAAYLFSVIFQAILFAAAHKRSTIPLAFAAGGALGIISLIFNNFEDANNEKKQSFEILRLLKETPTIFVHAAYNLALYVSLFLSSNGICEKESPIWAALPACGVIIILRGVLIFKRKSNETS